MNQNSLSSHAAAALTGDITEILRFATALDYHEVSRSSPSVLVTRLVQVAQRRRMRIEQLVVAIKRSLRQVARPGEMSEDVWDSIVEKLVSDSIKAYFAAADADKIRQSHDVRTPRP